MMPEKMKWQEPDLKHIKIESSDAQGCANGSSNPSCSMGTEAVDCLTGTAAGSCTDGVGGTCAFGGGGS